MKLLIALGVVAASLGGCGKLGSSGTEAMLTEALKSNEVKLLAVEQRLQHLERRVSNLDVSSKPTESWILWKGDQLRVMGVSNAPPHVLSAYPTRTECTIAATRLIEPGGTTVGNDPIEISYGNRRVTFYCLPPNISAGIR